MDKPINPEEFYNNLKEKLQETSVWPSEYLYKFIIKSDPVKINTIECIFDNMGAVIKTIPSKNGNYTSISINVVMKNPDVVIEKYKEVGIQVEGVISL
jgi:putative lipoic acid-binding regulatory protein|tara:strand:- start:6666 stop:6959 length:294 start_codon:yes stop_codon:yes gene_type:complete